ncbi:OmpA family protein [Variovorax brevis]|uniref:OmpA family protein n=1 Tax=Variovorax brevis TaxID=3053503 RepID=UPI0033653A65
MSHKGISFFASGNFRLDASVLFDFNQSTLKHEAKEMLSKTILQIERFSATKILIGGHTDNVGPPDYNMTLSESRAAAVEAFFKSSGRLASISMETKGYGKLRPISSNQTEEGRKKNRRVEIVITP